MRSIIWRSNSARLLLSGAALTILSPALPAFAQDTVDGAGETSTEDTAPLDPEAAQIVTEIEAIANGDPSADPEGDLAKLAELRARAQANGNVPLTDLGVLESQFGAAYFYLRDFEKALPYFDAAADLYTRGNAPLDEIAGLYNNQATILASLARYPESEEYHRKALAIRREMEGERGPFVASSLFGLGHIAYRQGRVLEALDYLRPAAEQTLEFLGPEDMLTSLRLTSLASVLGRAGYDAEAVETARLAVRLSREHLGEDHQLYGIAVNNLGHALMEARVLGEAIPVLREALRLRVATVGEDASGTAVSLRNLSQALMLDGKTEEAETLQRRAVEIYEKTGEVENPFALATMYEALAEHYAMRGDWQGYDELTGKAIASADAAWPPCRSARRSRTLGSDRARSLCRNARGPDLERTPARPAAPVEWAGHLGVSAGWRRSDGRYLRTAGGCRRGRHHAGARSARFARSGIALPRTGRRAR